MNLYPIGGAIMAFVLFAMGFFALIAGVQNYAKNKESKADFYMLLVCICEFIWETGYALMSLSYYSEFAYIARAIGFFAIYAFMTAALLYITSITGYPKIKLAVMLLVFFALFLVSYPYLITKETVWFVRTGWGYWYHTRLSNYRTIEAFSAVWGLLSFNIILYYGYKNAKTKREKKVYTYFALFIPSMLIGFVIDTLLPAVRHTPAVPGSQFGSFIATMILYYVAEKNRLLALSKEDVSDYVFDDVRIPVIITDVNLKIVMCNNFTMEFLKKESTSIIKHNINEFFQMNERDEINVIESGRDCKFEKTEIKDKYGELLYNIYFVRDITEEKKNFLLMKKSKEEAIEANKAKSDFLANMSHEIRTPMNAIIGMSQLILDNTVEAEVKNQVNEIRVAGTNLLGIINDILDMSKIEAGKMELIEEKYDLPTIIQEICFITSSRLEGKDVRFDVIADENLPKEVIGAAISLRRILTNIIGNAVKFTNKGRIVFHIRWNNSIENPILYFDVSDTGIGIRKEDINKIFGKYDQADTKKNRNIQGTGLGLSISKNLAKMMGGDITVESKYGEGSTFYVSVAEKIENYTPIGSEISELLGQKSYTIAGPKEIEVVLRPDTKVLIVDDTRVNLLVTSGLMKKYGMKIDLASSGKEAIELVKENDYTFILMDHMMPEMDGEEAMLAIRALGKQFENLPIIALTANVVNEAKDALLKVGFQDFLGKPISVDELDRVINKYSI